MSRFYLTLFAATFLMGSSFIAGKLLLQAGFQPFVLVGWRFVLAALATLPIAVWAVGRLRPVLLPPGLGARGWGIVVLIGLLQTAGVMALLFLSMRTVSASTAAILLFTNPIWVALLGRLFLAERLTVLRLAGLALGVLGVSFAIGEGTAAFTSGDLSGKLIGLGSALCWACSTIVNKRARLSLDTWTLTFWQMLIGALTVLALAYAIGERLPDQVRWADWGWFVWLAVPASTGSFGLWFLALRSGGATRASGYLFLAPLFTIVLSALILHTHPTALQALGALLVGLALWLVNREPQPGTAREQMSEALSEGEP